MSFPFNPQYPTVAELRIRAKQRIPGFVFDYVDGGCNEDVNLHKNTAEIRDVELTPYYLSKHSGSDLRTELFGRLYINL